MAESSKILTVSYGTFSCTLEGFEDSFGTMKAIAEYFRDLAADDRYFGAEPPTPDAEMLTRIAEREIARRVEARTSGDGIVLRAAGALGAPDRATKPEGPAPASATAAPAASAPVADVPRAAPPAPDVATQDPEVAAAPVAPASAGSAAHAATPAASLAAADPVTPSPQDAGQASAPTAAPAPDSVVDKLQRIRAVVGQRAEVSEDTGYDDAAEDVAAASEAAPAAGPLVLDSAAEDAELAEDESDAIVDEAATEPDPAPIDSAESEADPEVGATQAEDSTNDTEEETPAVTARVVRMMRSPAALQPEAGDDEDLDPEFDAADSAPAKSGSGFEGLVALDGADELDIAIDDEDGALDPDADADLLEELASVEREQAELDEDPDADRDAGSKASAAAVAALMGGQSAPDEDDIDEDDDEVANAFADLDDTDLDDEDIDGAEFDDVALADDDADDDDIDQVDDSTGDPLAPAGRTAVPGRDRLAGASMAEDEAAVSRLMSEADAKMADPEGRGRREAISHLKAAVAATEAARQLGDEDGQKDKTETAFRDDLNEAVRPSRPERSGPARPSRPIRPSDQPRTERPRPAPLKLVAAQRVDVAEDADDGDVAPVRPRRIDRPAGTLDRSGGAAEFVAWAQARGAASLTDLVEAAAVHTTMVDGVDAFARPQIMRKVRAAKTDAANREDELRAFGTLLRQGRFSKVRAGRFRVSTGSRFFEEPREAREQG